MILSADYSQIELRVLAHITQDESLKEAFIHGHDIHTATAMKVFNVEANDVTALCVDKLKLLISVLFMELVTMA